MNDSRIINLDVLAGLASLPPDTFHCAMTSPPYWRLRSYPGIAPTHWRDGQVVCLGAEADPGSFIRHLIEVFDGVRRVCHMACVPDAKEGDYVVVHAGIAISRVNPDEAKRVFEELAAFGDDEGWKDNRENHEVPG